ncbi:MAG: hypothetical protein M1830_006285, partial [Pleopsidium flavum]
MPGGPMNGISDRERACWVMRLLYCAGDLNTQHSLPSWVPDWKVDFKIRPLCVMHESIYRAGGDSLGKVQFCNDPQLRLSGRLWATVKISGTAELDLRRRMRARELHRMIAAWFAECNRTAAHCPVPLPDGRTPRGSVQANANCQRGGHGQGVFSVLPPLLQRLSFFSPEPPRFRDPRCVLNPRTKGYYLPVTNMAQGRVFLVTENGYMGLAPHGTRAGDKICVLLGGDMPVILRPEWDGRFMLIGECYVHGIMNGEVLPAEHREA